MNTNNSTLVKILVVTDIADDAMMVRSMLSGEFVRVFTSTDPKHAIADFDRHQPDILILAFNELEKSEQYYLGLYRLSKTVTQHAHRTIILCNKDEVTRVAELCMKDFFDDYILFWPMTYDAPRLLMSVHNAIRDLAANTAEESSTEEFAAQIRQLAELKNLPDDQPDEDGSSAIGKTEQNADNPKNETSHLNRDESQQKPFSEIKPAQPLKLETHKLKDETASIIKSADTLSHKKAHKPLTVLVVDDDEFQRNLINSLLKSENYHVHFAASGSEALSILRTTRPDVILMDVMMPNMDGIETTRRLKALPQFSKTPVIMVTGDSEGDVVVKSLKAGASNFVVKPFNSATLIDKINFTLGVTVPSKK